MLGGISALIPGEKSPLSPLHIPNPTELTFEQQNSLASSGLLQDGRLDEAAHRLLTTLGAATAFSRLRLSSPGGFLDEAIYFGEDGAETVQISNGPDGLTLASPGDAETLLARASEFTGSSARPVAPWAVELPPLEGLVLAGLLDLRRKAVIRALIDNQPVMPPPSDGQSIAAAINGLLGNAQWLAATVQNVCGLAGTPAPVQVQSALESLDGKHMVWQQGGNYFPLPEALQTADRFLITSTLLSLDLGHANSQGRVAFSRAAWLQSGVAEMLEIAQTVHQVRLETIPPSAVLEKVRYSLTHAGALPAPPLDVVELAVTIQVGVGAGQMFPLGHETVLGRSDQAQIRILDARASRQHALIRRLEQGYQVYDAGSTNGTTLNNQLLTGPAWLKEGDVIGIGETRILVLRAGATPPPPTGDRTVVAVESVPPEPLQIPEPDSPEMPQEPVPAEMPEPLSEPRFESAPPEPLETPEPSAPPSPAMDHCPRCGNVTSPGARFCGTCGFRLIE